MAYVRIVARSCFLALLLAVSSVAADAAPKVGRPGTNVEMPFLIAPMNKDGKLLGYVYISSKLVASSLSASIDIRNKLAFIQDAFVRDVNGEPIAQADNPQMADTELLTSRLVTDAKRIVGDTKVVTIVFTQVQFAPLHPTDSTLNEAPPNQVAPGSAPSAATAAGLTAPAPSPPQAATSKTPAATMR
jgi:hypothetical protein